MTDDPAKPGANGQINLAKRIPQSGEKLFIWRVPAPEQGPGMYRYSETPVMTAEERASIEPPAAVERPPMPQPPAAITDRKQDADERQRASYDAERHAHYDALKQRDAGGRRDKGGGADY